MLSFASAFRHESTLFTNEDNIGSRIGRRGISNSLKGSAMRATIRKRVDNR